MRHVLFLCGRNKARSPTAERVFESLPGLEVASAGVSIDADEVVSSELIEWADIIFVMEKSHRTKLTRQYHANLRLQKIVCLDIPDRYEYMDPALVELLKARVSQHLALKI
jgi:predicted protein tyrosine phosphatase